MLFLDSPQCEVNSLIYTLFVVC